VPVLDNIAVKASNKVCYYQGGNYPFLFLVTKFAAPKLEAGASIDLLIHG
jgi:hypothetical protein